MPSTAFPDTISIPDQRALIHFRDGTERLVVETRFAGKGTHFAWVVPLPSEPVVEEATTGLFPTLQYLFRPDLIDDVTPFYLAILIELSFLLGAAYLLFFPRSTTGWWWRDGIACAITAGVSGSNGLIAGLTLRQTSPEDMLLAFVALFLFAFCPSYLVVVLVRTGKLRKALACVFLPLIPAGLAILAMVMAIGLRARGSAASTASSVVVHDRRIVGVYETITISSRDPDALQTWLRDNQFVLPQSAAPVVADYAKNGWFFVVARIRRDSEIQDTSTPHPLSFTFTTDKPVYPMRLTGVDNGPLNVELYVFGPHRAEARPFRVEICTIPTYPSKNEYAKRLSFPDQPVVVHPLLRRWVDGAPVATKLTATLLPADMRGDVWIDWAPFERTRNEVFSRHGAWIWAINWASGICALGMLGLGALAYGHRPLRARVLWWAGILALAGIGLAGAIYWRLPNTDVRLVWRPWEMARDTLDVLAQQLDVSSLENARSQLRRLTANPPKDDQWLRMGSGYANRDLDNVLLGGKIREEDSPGNLVLKEENGIVRFFCYDHYGAEYCGTSRR